jgi:hypothetical protein
MIGSGRRADDGAAAADQGRLFYEFKLEDRIPRRNS